MDFASWALLTLLNFNQATPHTTMATYIVHYKLQSPSGGYTSSSKRIECETESTAVQGVKSQALASAKDKSFILVKVEKR